MEVIILVKSSRVKDQDKDSTSAQLIRVNIRAVGLMVLRKVKECFTMLMALYMKGSSNKVNATVRVK